MTRTDLPCLDSARIDTNRIDSLGAPLLVSWQLTHECDLACLHCCTDSGPRRQMPRELHRSEALALAAAIVDFGVPYVMLCGGEPLLVPHFLDVAAYLGAAAVQLKIETNGQILDQALVARLRLLPIRSVQISLDGDTEATYRRQRPGASLVMAHRACAMVAEAGLPLEITFAPTRLNIHEAEAVIRRARGFGAFRFNTGKLMPVGRAARLWHKLVPSDAQYAKLREVLQFQDRIFGDGMEFCYEPFSIEDGLRQSLRSPPATLLIQPDGTVKMAGPLDHLCGDVRSMSLAQIWDQYRAAWRNESLLATIHHGILQSSSPADSGVRRATPEELTETCAT